MGDMEYLQEKIEASGLKDSFIANKAGIGRVSFYARLKGDQQWKSNEMATIKELLHLDEKDFLRIFF